MRHLYSINLVIFGLQFLKKSQCHIDHREISFFHIAYDFSHSFEMTILVRTVAKASEILSV